VIQHGAAPRVGGAGQRMPCTGWASSGKKNPVAIDVSEDVEPVERVREACRSYRDFALRHPARYSLIFGAGSPLEDQSSEVASAGRAVFAVLVRLIGALRTTASEEVSAEAAQLVWSAVHGAVTIEQARIGQTPDAVATFEHMLDLLTRGVTSGR
jgi:hypothetical protein